MHEIIVLSKEGCHLCERAVSTLAESSTGGKFMLKVVDISNNNAFEEYLLRIPVVLLDGKIVFEVEEIALPADCKRKLTALVSHL